jgi:glycosyltransferase involved in cell wall biosynthesis
MRILYVVDGRSPIALNWVRYFCDGEHEVHLVSTFPCEPELKPTLASFHVIPVAFGDVGDMGGGDRGGGMRDLIRRVIPVGVRTGLRQWLGPLTLPRAARALRDLLDQIQPDLVHAMRIPYEGMLAALAMEGHGEGGHKGPPQGGYIGPPLLVSVWGNDFTLHASATPAMARLTRLALREADALHTDCQRDLNLAYCWGYPEGKPAVVLPGGGGVQLDVFYPPDSLAKDSEPSQGLPTVINPRGFRSYVCNEAFFHAIRLVLGELPRVRFICPAMAGEAQAERWIEALGIGEAVELLPQQTRQQMAELFRRSQVAVSPSTHDGTPNTLLEAMACGCTPVAGDIESLREWITPGENGLLVDPRDPVALAEAILRTLGDADLHRRARESNTRLVAERAEYGRVMGEAEEFYFRLRAG